MSKKTKWQVNIILSVLSNEGVKVVDCATFEYSKFKGLDHVGAINSAYHMFKSIPGVNCTIVVMDDDCNTWTYSNGIIKSV